MAGRGGVAERIAAAQQASAESLVAYAGDTSPAVRRTAAARPDAPGEALRALAADRDLATREAVAGNPAVPEDALITLLADRHWRVRLTAAGNPANHEQVPTFLDSLVTRTFYSDPARLGEPTPRLAAIPDELTQLPPEELHATLPR